MPPMPGEEPLAFPALVNPPLPPPTASQVAVQTAGKAFRYGRPVVGLLLTAAALSLGIPLAPALLLIAAGALVRP